MNQRCGIKARRLKTAQPNHVLIYILAKLIANFVIDK